MNPNRLIYCVLRVERAILYGYVVGVALRGTVHIGQHIGQDMARVDQARAAAAYYDSLPYANDTVKAGEQQAIVAAETKLHADVADLVGTFAVAGGTGAIGELGLRYIEDQHRRRFMERQFGSQQEE